MRKCDVQISSVLVLPPPAEGVHAVRHADTPGDRAEPHLRSTDETSPLRSKSLIGCDRQISGCRSRANHPCCSQRDPYPAGCAGGHRTHIEVLWKKLNVAFEGYSLNFRIARDPGTTPRLTGRAKSTVGHEG